LISRPCASAPRTSHPWPALFLNRDKTEEQRLSRAALQTLASHHWPGNVRELANAMAHVRLLSQTDVILPEHLPPAVRKAAGKTSAESRLPAQPGAPAATKTLEQHEIEAVPPP
jgi:two-component system, NtrC family, response regulator HydG